MQCESPYLSQNCAISGLTGCTCTGGQGPWPGYTYMCM